MNGVCVLLDTKRGLFNNAMDDTSNTTRLEGRYGAYLG